MFSIFLKSINSNYKLVKKKIYVKNNRLKMIHNLYLIFNMIDFKNLKIF